MTNLVLQWFLATWVAPPTVPSLAIYEALRAPGEPGIAQYRYTWDGNVLVGEG